MIRGIIETLIMLASVVFAISLGILAKGGNWRDIRDFFTGKE